MKYCIYGAGAIGGWLGVKLALAGHAVSVVARGATLEAIQRDGLRLEQQGQVSAATVTASADPATLGPQDVVIVAVKEPAMAAVAAAIAPLLGPDTVVLTAMNGVPWWFLDGLGGEHAGQRLTSVDADGAIGAALPIARIVGGVVHASCALNGPGFVHHHFGQRLIVGEARGGGSARVRALAADLEAAGIEAPVSERIQRDIWFKLWGNMTINPISAITGATSDRVLDDELVRAFVSRVMLEAKAIGARLGIPIDQAPEDRHAITRRLGAFKTSMLQDVEAGRAVELDALVGTVRELGQHVGVPTPDTDALFGLARLHARVRGLY
jgi:2-dehydropantoate 2-reductase